MQIRKGKKMLIVGIELLIAVLHVIGVGRTSSEKVYVFFTSYFSDLVLPFGFYFLLILGSEKFEFLRKKWVRTVIMIAIPSGMEILQYFGIYALGLTFDPFDILCYAIGVITALMIDLILEKTPLFWNDIRITQNGIE